MASRNSGALTGILKIGAGGIGFDKKSEVKDFKGYSLVNRIRFDGSEWNWLENSLIQEDAPDGVAGSVIKSNFSVVGAWQREREGGDTWASLDWFQDKDSPSAPVGAVINSILGLFTTVHVPAKTRYIEETVLIPSGKHLDCDYFSLFKPAVDNLVMFSTESAFTSSLLIDRLTMSGTGTGFNNVTGLNLINCGTGVSVSNPVATDIKSLIVVTTSYGLVIDRPKSFRVSNPVKVVSGGTIAINHPELDNSSAHSAGSGQGVGVEVVTGDVVIEGGYIQGFADGFSDKGAGSRLHNVYFELCINHINLDGTESTYIERCHGLGAGSSAMIKAVNTNSVRVIRPSFSTSNSVLGLYNVDGSNRNFGGSLERISASRNNKLGIITGITPVAGEQTSWKDGIQIKRTFTNDEVTEVFKVKIGDYSVTNFEVNAYGIEKTAYNGSTSKKFIFSVNRATASVPSNVVEVVGYAYQSLANNSVVTPEVTASIDGDGDVVISVEMKRSGPVGWLEVSGGVTLKVESTALDLSVGILDR